MWEENDTNPHVFPHKLFKEVELQSIFDCTVEVGSLFWRSEQLSIRPPGSTRRV